MLSWVEINGRALTHNLSAFKKIVGDRVAIMFAIKGNAYGHGFKEIAAWSQNNRQVDTLCVVSLEEALDLIRYRYTKKPILILSFFDFDLARISKAIRSNVIFPIYNLDQAKYLQQAGDRNGKRVRVHLKIDTGAGRVGILPSELRPFLQKLRQYKNLEIDGVFSHYAASEEDSAYTKKQLLLFNQVISDLNTFGVQPRRIHLSCTAASVLYPETRFNSIRVGLGLYGLYSDAKTRLHISLHPVMTWKSKVMNIKRVPKGSKISYGGTYTTRVASILAVIPVGYYDGYDRSLSNQSSVLIRGQLCPVRGRVCMNMIMVDVTKVRDIRIGDEVVLIGTQGRKTISADDLAKFANTINYEIVDRINPQLPRIII